MLSGFAWLGRAADKARAKRAGMLGDYMSLCPFDKGFLERTGITEATFEELIAQGVTDEELGSYFERHVAPAKREEANRWVLVDMAGHVGDETKPAPCAGSSTPSSETSALISQTPSRRAGSARLLQPSLAASMTLTAPP